MEKEEEVELVTSYVSGTTRPGFIVTCDLNYLRRELREFLKRDKRCQDFIENVCRGIWKKFDFLPPEILEDCIQSSIENLGPDLTGIPIEAMVSYFATQLKSKLDETWDSLLVEAIALWPGLNVESGNLNWPALPAETIEKLAKPFVEQMKRRIGIGRPGRTKGTGLFKSTEDFCAALQDVFQEFGQKPSEKEVIERLRRHDLCRQRESPATLQSQTRTLRGWLQKAGFRDFHDAWRKHLLSRKSGK